MKHVARVPGGLSVQHFCTAVCVVSSQTYQDRARWDRPHDLEKAARPRRDHPARRALRPRSQDLPLASLELRDLVTASNWRVFSPSR